MTNKEFNRIVMEFFGVNIHKISTVGNKKLSEWYQREYVKIADKVLHEHFNTNSAIFVPHNETERYYEFIKFGVIKMLRENKEYVRFMLL